MEKIFSGRKIIVATKHKKEQVIAPLLEKELGFSHFVTQDLDTDLFGTFTGEVERLTNPIETARLKCQKAMELSGCDIAIANEGSFGIHPTLFFVHADSEIVLLVDKKNNREFIVREISTKTNFNGREITTYEQMLEFADSVLFPSHALILRKSRSSSEDIYKGIIHRDDLKKTFDLLKEKYGTLYAETDMRALYNPTRMDVIEQAVRKLVSKLKSECPKCSAPGFSAVEAKPGLCCENCGSPTRSTLSHLMACDACNHEEEKLYPNGRTSEDPMYCDVCNP